MTAVVVREPQSTAPGDAPSSLRSTGVPVPVERAILAVSGGVTSRAGAEELAKDLFGSKRLPAAGSFDDGTSQWPSRRGSMSSEDPRRT